MTRKKTSEHGQVLILLVLVMVGLFAFAALAIDGGLIYSDRRIAQNAADSSSLAGAGAAGQEVQWIVKDSWTCSSSDIIAAESIAVAAAIASANENDYVIDDDIISDDNGVTTYCEDGDDKYLDVEVKITDQTESSFAHLFFNRPLVNTVEAKARINPRFPIAEGYNIISLTDECGSDKGTFINGGPEIVLTGGGGFFSNSCFICSGGAGSITGDSIEYLNSITCTNITLNVPSITHEDEPFKPEIDIDGACDNVPVGTETNVNMGGGINDITYTPGSYNSISVTDSKDMAHLEPGLYCVSGPVKILGKSFDGIGVTIALLGTSNPDGFQTASTTEVHLSAAPANCSESNTCNGAIGGLLIWAHPDNTSDISLLGSSGSSYDGTVYGYNNTIIIGGGSSLDSIDYGTQLIGDVIKISGDSNININYDESYFFHTRASLEVAK